MSKSILDEDEFKSDLLYMRGLVDGIEEMIDRVGLSAQGIVKPPILPLERLNPAALWEVFPDRAAEQLAAWRDESSAAALSVAVLTAVAYTNPERPAK